MRAEQLSQLNKLPTLLLTSENVLQDFSSNERTQSKLSFRRGNYSNNHSNKSYSTEPASLKSSVKNWWHKVQSPVRKATNASITSSTTSHDSSKKRKRNPNQNASGLPPPLPRADSLRIAKAQSAPMDSKKGNPNQNA